MIRCLGRQASEVNSDFPSKDKLKEDAMKYVMGVIVGAILLASTAAAQVQQGDQEIQFLGSIMAYESNATITLQGTYGLFITPELELGVGPQLVYSKSPGGHSTLFGARFFGRFNFFVNTKTVPYVTGQWNQYDFAPDEPSDFFDASFLQGGVGVKIFASEHVAYDFSGNVGFSLGEFDPSITLLGGLSFFF
jgi:hypothetical protein